MISGECTEDTQSRHCDDQNQSIYYILHRSASKNNYQIYDKLVTKNLRV